MNESEMETEINDIVLKCWNESCVTPVQVKLACLKAYKAGMEAARKIYTS